jgi:hypothetical protein
VAKAGEKATSAKERELNKTCGDLLLKICRKYDNLAEVDKLSSVSAKVESVKLVMQDNIDIALQNCVKLESIGKAAGECLLLILIFCPNFPYLEFGTHIEELQQQAGVFKRNAHELKKRMWWKNLKVNIDKCICYYAINVFFTADEADFGRYYLGHPRCYCGCDRCNG